MKKRLILINILTLLLVLSLISAFSFPDLFNFQKPQNQLKVTYEHPFLINNNWIQAKDLKVGDEIKTIDGKKAKIKSIEEIVSDKPINVYNLESKLYSNFVVGDGLIVHNSNVPKGSKIPLEFIETPNGRVPIPHKDYIPVFNREEAINWRNRVVIPNSKPHLQETMGEVMTQIIDNVERVDFPEFSISLERAVREFDNYIDNQPYTMVIYRTKGSDPWTYDIASQWLKNKPANIVYTYDERGIAELIDSGSSKFVFFDDASYSGSRITDDTGKRIAEIYDEYSRLMGMPSDDLEFISVLARSSSGARNTLESSKTLNNRGYLISGGEMKTVEDVLKPMKLDDRIYDEVVEELARMHINDDQSLVYFDHKVADQMSFPSPISSFISLPGRSIPYRTMGLEPYKQPGTEYLERVSKREEGSFENIFK